MTHLAVAVGVGVPAQAGQQVVAEERALEVVGLERRL